MREKGRPRPDCGPLAGYDHAGFWCELYGGASAPAPHAARVCARLARMDLSELRRRAQAAGDELFNLGITFTIYSDRDAIDRILPFDVIPRVLSAADWQIIEIGRQAAGPGAQSVPARLYHEQKILQRRRGAARPGARQCQLPPGDAGSGAAARRLRPHLRHRHRARRAGQLPGARGQRAHPVRRVLRDREPLPDAARLPRSALRVRACAGSTSTGCG